MSWAAGEFDRRQAGMIRMATVLALDPGAARVRVSFGGDTESAWLPFMVQRAGGARIWAPPTVGEQVVVAAPSGDTSQGVILGSIFQNAFPTPSSDGETFEIHLGSARIIVEDGKITIEVGGSRVVISDGGVQVDGPQLRHNAKNVGDDHTHGGVQSGPSSTDGPD